MREIKKVKKMASIFILLCLIAEFACKDARELSLKQVLIVSRHNIRTPLPAELKDYTPNEWPTWTAKPGYLTEKGAAMESYMGDYFADWFMQNEFITGCPDSKSTTVYANAPQRTVETARMFVKSAFNCDVSVYYKSGITMDPMFNPIIRNTSEEFEDIAVKDIARKLEELDLKEQYEILADVLNLNNSVLCKKESVCDLQQDPNDPYIQVNEEPDIDGPLYATNKMIDQFLMQYYNNTPLEKIGWGAMTEQKLQTLLKIAEVNQKIRFGTKTIATDVAKPILNYIAKKFTDENNKLTILVGHDSNLQSIMAAFDFKPYELQNQYEITPIGGKIVFQKWFDENTSQNLLKVEYIYPTLWQLRAGVKLSWETPPQVQILEIEGCKLDNDGFCLWSDFENIFKKFL